jgi:hypothetical protein
MVNDASVLLWVSSFGTEFFVIHPLTCDYFLGKAQAPVNSQRCLTHFHIAQYFCTTPWTWETWLHPKRSLLAVSGRWSVSPSTSWGRPEFEPGFLPVWWVVLPAPHQVLCIQGLHPNLPQGRIPSGSSCPLAPGRIFSWWQGRWQITISTILATSPKEMLLRYRTLRQFSRKQHFIVLTQTQQTHIQRLSCKNKRVSPYIPLQAGCRSKKQSATHIWLHVTLLAISFPQC